jgi:predicted RNA binding protein YcfA (HicA-like mRNA interferase family)
MATYTFNDFRRILTKLNFQKIRSRKHETWRKILEDGTILRVRISNKAGKDVPKWLFHEMLRQAGIDEQRFRDLLPG